MIDSLVRKNIKDLQPYSSARSLYQKGVFFDANENALGSAATLQGYPELNRYPDPYSKELRKALGEFLGVSEKNVFAGNGSDEIIDLLIRVFVEPSEEIVVLEPTYGMYKVAGDTAGNSGQGAGSAEVGDGAQEGVGIGMGRGLKEGADRGFLDNFTAVHDGDAVGDFRDHTHVMGNQ